jgi:hypothetical protein
MSELSSPPITLAVLAECNGVSHLYNSLIVSFSVLEIMKLGNFTVLEYIITSSLPTIWKKLNALMA